MHLCVVLSICRLRTHTEFARCLGIRLLPADFAMTSVPGSMPRGRPPNKTKVAAREKTNKIVGTKRRATTVPPANKKKIAATAKSNQTIGKRKQECIDCSENKTRKVQSEIKE